MLELKRRRIDMLNKEDILALAWEYSDVSGKRYTFTEQSLLEMIWIALSRQSEPVECPVCCSDEPHTGTCGSSDPPALCNRTEAEPAAFGFDYSIQTRTATGTAQAEPAPAQDEREAFEQHYHRFDLSRDPVSGAYFDSEVRCLWDAWQARATRPAQTEQQPEQSGLVEALEEIASGLQAEFAWELAEQALAAYCASQETNKI